MGFPYSDLIFSSLRDLYIDGNSLTGTISENIAYIMPKLRDARMNNNNFEGCIPEDLFDMPYLKTLYLSNNHLSCELTPNIYLSQTLVDFRIKNNNFYGALPPVQLNSYLQSFDISYNAFSETIPV